MFTKYYSVLLFKLTMSLFTISDIQSGRVRAIYHLGYTKRKGEGYLQSPIYKEEG